MADSRERKEALKYLSASQKQARAAVEAEREAKKAEREAAVAPPPAPVKRAAPAAVKKTTVPPAPKVTEPAEAVEPVVVEAPKFTLPPDIQRDVDYFVAWQASTGLAEEVASFAAKDLGMSKKEFQRVAEAQGVNLADIYEARRKGRTFDEYAKMARERGVIGFMPVAEREAAFRRTVDTAEKAMRGVAPDTIGLKKAGADSSFSPSSIAGGAATGALIGAGFGGVPGALIGASIGGGIGAASGYAVGGTSTVFPEVSKPGEHGHTLASMLVGALKNDTNAVRLYDLYGRGFATGNTQRYIEDRTQELLRRSGTSPGTAAAAAIIDRLRRQALNEVIAYKTVGQWTPAVTLQDVEVTEGGAPPGVFDALKPNVELIGFNNQNQAVFRQESPLGVLFRTIDIPQEAVVGALQGSAARGVQTGANFLELALETTEGASPFVRYPAVTAGFVASVLFPDLLLAGGAAYKGARAAAKTAKFHVAKKEAVALLEAVANARKAGDSAAAVEAESKLRRLLPAEADNLDRFDAAVADTLRLHNPETDIYSEDMAALLGSRPGQFSEVAQRESIARVWQHPSMRKEVLAAKLKSRDIPTNTYAELFDTARHKARIDAAEQDYLANAPKTVNDYTKNYARGAAKYALSELVDRAARSKGGMNVPALSGESVDKLAEIVADASLLLLKDIGEFRRAVTQALMGDDVFRSDAYKLVRNELAGGGENRLAAQLERKIQSIRGKSINDLQAEDRALFKRARTAIEQNNEARGMAAALLHEEIAKRGNLQVQPLKVFDDVLPRTVDGEPLRLSPGGSMILYLARNALPSVEFRDLVAGVSMLDQAIISAAKKQGRDPYDLLRELVVDIRKGTPEDLQRLLGVKAKAPAGAPPTPPTPSAPAAAAPATSAGASTAAARLDSMRPSLPVGTPIGDVQTLDDAMALLQKALTEPTALVQFSARTADNAGDAKAIIIGDVRIVVDYAPDKVAPRVFVRVGTAPLKVVKAPAGSRKKAFEAGFAEAKKLIEARITKNEPAIKGAPVVEAPGYADALEKWERAREAAVNSDSRLKKATADAAKAVDVARKARAARLSAERIAELEAGANKAVQVSFDLDTRLTADFARKNPEPKRRMVFVAAPPAAAPTPVPAPATAVAAAPAPPKAAPGVLPVLASTVEARREQLRTYLRANPGVYVGNLFGQFQLLPADVKKIHAEVKAERAVAAAPAPAAPAVVPAPKVEAPAPEAPKAAAAEAPVTPTPEITPPAAPTPIAAAAEAPVETSWEGARVVDPLRKEARGVVVKWEPLGSAMNDALVRYDDGSELWVSSAALRAEDGVARPTRAQAVRRADEKALADLKAIRDRHIAGFGEKWPGAEFGKVTVGDSLNAAIAEVEARLARSGEAEKIVEAPTPKAEAPAAVVETPATVEAAPTSTPQVEAPVVRVVRVSEADIDKSPEVKKVLKARNAAERKLKIARGAQEEAAAKLEATSTAASKAAQEKARKAAVAAETALRDAEAADAAAELQYQAARNAAKQRLAEEAGKQQPLFAPSKTPEFPSIERDARRVDINRAAKKRQADIVIARLYGEDLAAEYEEIPSQFRVAAAQRLRKAEEGLAAGKITQEQFNKLVEAVSADLSDQARIRRTRAATAGRRRGADWVRSRLLAAKSEGTLDEAGVDLADWFIQQNPSIADDLAVSVRKGGELSPTAGFYEKNSRLVALFKEKGSELTATHEVLHHTERMLPDALRIAIRDEWSKRLTQSIKTATPEQRPLLSAMLTGSEPERVREALLNGELPIAFYQYTNPSEFWAVNASSIVAGRYAAFNKGLVAKAKQWLTEFVQKAKSVFGLQSDAPLIRGLDAVLKGDGTFVSQQMLSEAAFVAPPAKARPPAPTPTTPPALTTPTTPPARPPKAAVPRPPSKAQLAREAKAAALAEKVARREAEVAAFTASPRGQRALEEADQVLGQPRSWTESIGARGRTAWTATVEPGEFTILQFATRSKRQPVKYSLDYSRGTSFRWLGHYSSREAAEQALSSPAIRQSLAEYFDEQQRFRDWAGSVRDTRLAAQRAEERAAVALRDYDEAHSALDDARRADAEAYESAVRSDDEAELARLDDERQARDVEEQARLEVYQQEALRAAEERRLAAEAEALRAEQARAAEAEAERLRVEADKAREEEEAARRAAEQQRADAEAREETRRANPALADLEDRFPLSRPGDIKTVLREVRESTTNASYKRIIDRLLEQGGRFGNTRFIVAQAGDVVPGKVANSLSGGGNGITLTTFGGDLEPHAIYLRGTSVGALDAPLDELILHEAIHAATVDQYEIGIRRGAKGTPTAAAALAINELQGQVVRELNRRLEVGEELMGLSRGDIARMVDSPAELIAYGMTNPQFQSLLKTIKVESAKTAWTKFVESVARLLGLAPDDESALAALIERTERLMDISADELEATRRMVFPNAKPETVASEMRAAPTPSGIPAAPLRQVGPTGEVKGLVETVNDGRSVIYLFENADVSTLLHEFSHIFRRRLLDATDMERITDWIRTQGVDVDHKFGEFVGSDANIEKAEELFGVAFERYIMNGEAPTPGLRDAFDTLKQAMAKVYQNVKSPVVGLRLSDEVRAVFDKMVEDVPEASFPSLREVFRREMLGRTEEAPGFIDRLAAEAQRKGIPRASVEDLQKQFDIALSKNEDPQKPYISFPSPVLGKRDWTFNEIAEAQTKLAEEGLNRAARLRGPKMNLGAKIVEEAAVIEEDSPVESLRSALTARKDDAPTTARARTALRSVAGTFFGGDVVGEKGARLLPPEMRKALDAVERRIEESIGDTVSLINDVIEVGQPQALESFLAGGAKVARAGGRPIVSAGHDYMGSFRQMIGRAFDALSPDERQALNLWADIRSKKNWAELLPTIGYSRTFEPIENVAEAVEKTRNNLGSAVTKLLYKSGSAKDELGIGLAQAIARAVQAPQVARPSHEFKMVELMTYIAGKTGRPTDGATVEAFGGTSREAVRLFLNEAGSIYDEASMRRLAVVIGGYGSADLAKLTLVKLNLGVSKEAADAFQNWIVGQSWPGQYTEEIQRILSRYGVNPDFVSDTVLGVDFYIPKEARTRMADALARVNYRPAEAATGVDAFNNLYRYMKKRMTRGNFFLRQRYYMMNTVDHFIQLGMTAGFGVAANSVTRLIAQDLMVLPAWQQLVDGARKLPGGQRIPRDILERARRGLQAGGDVLGNRIGQLFGVSKYRIEVNPILEGLDGGFRAGNKVYSYREIRNIAVEEGIFASFDTRQLASSIQREGALYINREISRWGEVAGAGAPTLEQARGNVISGKLRNFLADWEQTVSDTAEAWGERERIGAMVALMEAGHDPRIAARLTIDALYDYSQSMTKTDRSIIVGIMFPFWAFQKNANAQVFNQIFSPWGAYRMMAIRRARERSAELLTAILYGEVAGEYGLDVESMPPDLQDSYYSLVTEFESAYDGDPPKEAKRAFRMLLTGVGTDVEEGYLYQLSPNLLKMREEGRFAELSKFGGYVQLAPSAASRMTYLRERAGIGVRFPRTEAVRLYYSLLGDEHAYMEVFLPESSIEGGFRHITQLVATYTLMAASAGDLLAGGALTEKGLREVKVTRVLEPVFDPERSPILGPLIADMSIDAMPPKRLAKGLIAVGGAGQQVATKIHPLIGKLIDDLYGTTLLRTPADVDPFVVDPTGKNLQQLTPEQVERIKALQAEYPDAGTLRDQRYYIPGGVWSMAFENTPFLGELNALLIRWEEEPLERMNLRGEILRLSRFALGIDVSMTSSDRAARFEEPKKLRETKGL